ncbi:MAG TPA: glutamine--fructose-6-phosphate transaminase (isomerizing) [Prolixibacteraceae bacterium]|nr:glutamine--fructose-6-phosphate transaminase (isomerizing) [Prolixibacteraceae bacterium]
MCGIVGYAGEKSAYPFLIQGLKRLEYRGYDSAGLAISGHSLQVHKCKGRVSDLEKHVISKELDGSVGIAHTRWATHGEPNDMNAHPHRSMNGHFALVHNGIIENYAELKVDLTRNGFDFQSDTDTEVLVNLIEFFYGDGSEISAEVAIRMALSKVVGAYGIAVICMEEKDQLIVARRGSPLVIGIGQGEYFVASDATPVIGYTNNVIYLNDHDLAIISKGSLTIKTMEDKPASFQISRVDRTIGEIEKGDFAHFMLKEIFEQPKTIEDTFRGRVSADRNSIVLGGLMDVFPRLVKAKRIILIGCGTSWHAALVGEYLIETYARIPVEVEYASEFRYRNPILSSDDVVIAISQSGETSDTLVALRMAKACGATILGICNVVGSSIARETDAGVYTHAGIEIGVASTKAFTAQLTVLTLFALKLAFARGELTAELYTELIRELAEIPAKITTILASYLKIKDIANKYKDAANALYLGRGALFPVALEGALKLKEISYLHAEGYAAGEMKHGPIALVDDNLPVVVVSPKDHYYEKIVSNIQEVKARKGNIIAVVTEGDVALKEMVQDVFEIPDSHPAVTPLLAIIPLQLFSYYMAVSRGCDVDQPRNLAKSVTVE